MGLFGSLVKLGFGGPPDMLPWEQLNLQDEQQRAIAGNTAAMSNLTSQARKVNTFNQQEIQRMLELSMPGYAKLRDRGTGIVNNLMSGEIPSDVSNAIWRGGAAKSLYGGFGGSGMARNLKARDLGLTSLDLMTKGLDSATKWIAMSRSLAPTFDITSMFVSPMQQAAFSSSERDKRIGYGNTKRQFEYATDPMREVESDVAGIADMVGTALMAYMGGAGGGMMSGLGGMMGMGGGGGTSSAMQMLSGFMGSGESPSYSASRSSMGGFKFNPNTGYFE